LAENAQEFFSLPVRIGNPNVSFDIPETLRNPSYATGYGLLLQSLKQENDSGINQHEVPLTKQIFERMKRWALDFF
jgi:cell division ATPase FtsA